jgi:hypothetical protein
MTDTTAIMSKDVLNRKIFAENEYSPTLNHSVFINKGSLFQQVTRRMIDATALASNNNGA